MKMAIPSNFVEKAYSTRHIAKWVDEFFEKKYDFSITHIDTLRGKRRYVDFLNLIPMQKYPEVAIFSSNYDFSAHKGKKMAEVSIFVLSK